jgi:hypothetical protein
VRFTAEQIGCINAILVQARKYRFIDSLYDLMGFLGQVEYKFLKIAQNECHFVNHILPPLTTANEKLRARGHKFSLLFCHFELYKRSFTPRFRPTRTFYSMHAILLIVLVHKLTLKMFFFILLHENGCSS